MHVFLLSIMFFASPEADFELCSRVGPHIQGLIQDFWLIWFYELLDSCSKFILKDSVYKQTLNLPSRLPLWTHFPCFFANGGGCIWFYSNDKEYKGLESFWAVIWNEWILPCLCIRKNSLPDNLENVHASNVTSFLERYV